MADTKYLSADQVLELHRLALTVGPNRGEGTRSEHLFQSAVAQPQQTFCGQDLYETVGQKAAALAFSLAENQPFVDGNKRTAALAMTVFLDINGHTLWLEHDLELAEVFEAIGHKRLDQPGFFAWVEERVRLSH
jgi:death on curing protein